MSKVGEAIRMARKAKGLTLVQLSEMADIDQGNLSRLERGKQGASQDLLERLFVALGMSLSGAIAHSTMHSNVRNVELKKTDIPVLPWGLIKRWMDDMRSFTVVDVEKWVPCPVDHGPRAFVVQVEGDSMNSPHLRRSFRSGDYAYIDPDAPEKTGVLVIAQVGEADNDPVFRQLIIEGGERYLKALNPGWPDPIVRMAHTDEILGVAIYKGSPL